MPDVAIRPLEARDRTAWRAAYEAYAIEVDSPIDETIAARVWTWLLKGDHELIGLVAHVDDALAAFAHVRPFPRTLDGNEAGYLDDLWVAPAFRGTGLVRAVFTHIASIARERGWTHVRWVTHTENARGRALYERIAKPMALVTYRLDTSDRR